MILSVWLKVSPNTSVLVVCCAGGPILVMRRAGYTLRGAAHALGTDPKTLKGVVIGLGVRLTPGPGRALMLSPTQFKKVQQAWSARQRAAP